MSIDLHGPATFARNPSGTGVETLIDELLKQQQTLTPVERFSAIHDRLDRLTAAPAFRELLPLSRPRPGEQYAFEVDLDRCSGCKACVTACHSLNGLEEEETWRDVGLLVGHERSTNSGSTSVQPLPWKSADRPAHQQVIPLQQTVTTACHHCVEPGCLLGCPVNAYEKDPSTGIVRHLDDQCIGCSYCILKCPYDVPKFSKRLGIVRKCDLCHGRLAAGEAPACVQACPSEAIRITVVNQSELQSRWGLPRGTSISNGSEPGTIASNGEHTTTWLPDSPRPDLTVPTTRYLTRRELGEMVSAGAETAPLEPAHAPLIWMLVLTQAGVGLLLAGVLVAFLAGFDRSIPSLGAAFGSVSLLLAGLVAGVFHLGQPLRAWRSFLGWRTSWLSREMLAFGALVPMAMVVVLLEFLVQFNAVWAQALIPAWGLAGILGCVAVYTSVMIYADTGRASWNLPGTALNFFGTAALLGSGLACVLLLWMEFLGVQDPTVASAKGFCLATTLIRTGLFGYGCRRNHEARSNQKDSLHRSIRLLDRRVPWLPFARWGLFGSATVFAGLTFIVSHGLVPIAATLSLLFTFLAQGLERWTFFVGCAPQRMPGLPE